MQLSHAIWNEVFAEKILRKHGVTEEEAEEVLFSGPHIRRAEKGKVKNEHVYAAYGQTEDARYLVVFFIYKGRGSVFPISARDMTQAERRYLHGQSQAN